MASDSVSPLSTNSEEENQLLDISTLQAESVTTFDSSSQHLVTMEEELPDASTREAELWTELVAVMEGLDTGVSNEPLDGIQLLELLEGVTDIGMVGLGAASDVQDYSSLLPGAETIEAAGFNQSSLTQVRMIVIM